MAQPKAKLYPGDKHKDAVRAVNPTMLLSDWLQTNYKHVTFDNRIAKGGTSLVVPDCNVNLTFALISTDNIQQFARLALREAPVGTIYDKIPLAIGNLTVKAVKPYAVQPKPPEMLHVIAHHSPVVKPTTRDFVIVYGKWRIVVDAKPGKRSCYCKDRHLPLAAYLYEITSPAFLQRITSTFTPS